MLKDIFNPNKRTIVIPLAFLFSTVIGGYTIKNFPQEFFQFFATPIGRFIAFFPILYIYYKDEKDVSLVDILYECILFVIILELLGLILNFMYNK